MKVTLLDYTGAGTADPAGYAARLLIYAKSTRLTQGEELKSKINAMALREIVSELEVISRTIRSSWEFVVYTWQITGVTRAFTHQFVRSRHASFAQEAMRVSDQSNFRSLVPDSVQAADKAELWQSCMSVIAETYQELRAAGVPAQDARGVLPTNVLTNIVASFNLRAFADLCGKRDNPRAQDEYATVVQAMKAEVLRVHPWADIFLDPPRTDTPHLDKLLRAALGNRSPVDAPEINDALKDVDKLKATWG
jgi:thymidylate synthase (FAD)